ncbi:beta-lactamase/transpeptidase-like protein [Aspergillus unguis]
MSVQGYCDHRFLPVRRVFAERLKTNEIGASVCVTFKGETVVDLWGGHTTPARTTPWSRNTISPVWSISKTISAVATLMLIDRGLISPDDPVSKFWPAFDTEDKRGVLVKHFLSHSAGLPSWNPPLPVEELFGNQPLATEKLVAQKPWWTPGTASGYHLISQGVLLGGLVERVSGKSLPEFVSGELATPLNADFHMGLRDEKQWGRIAEMKPPPPPPKGMFSKKNISADSPMRIAIQAMTGCALAPQHSNTPPFWQCGIGSFGGLSNARGFNRILEIITQKGTLEGKQFLKPSTVDMIFQTQVEGPDLVLGVPLRLGMGFGLSNGSIDWMPRGRVCFWGGYGGSIAIMDLDREVTVTYSMNRMEEGTLGNSNAEAYVRAAYEVIYALTGEKQANL